MMMMHLYNSLKFNYLKQFSYNHSTSSNYPPIMITRLPTSVYKSRKVSIFVLGFSHSPNRAMEIEVKLRLPDLQSHQKLSSLLSAFHVKTHVQENYFFDTKTSQLATRLAALRIRFYNLDSRCVLSLKAKPLMSDGISRVEEQEEPIDPQMGRTCVAEPSSLGLLVPSKIMDRVREEFGVKDIDGLVCLGGFRNIRQVFDWKNLNLELDETIYDFGTSYEIECESKDPEKDKKLIEGLLNDNGIQFSYSDVNKFAVFRSRKLPQ